MTKTLTKHGNSYALVIDRAIMDLLHIAPETPLSIATDGKSLVITPVQGDQKRKRLDAALKRINKRFSGTLKKLAE